MTIDNADASVATKNREDLPTLDYDAIVIGAGFAGLALIHYLRKLDLNVRVFDRASDVGGTWAWNHYPGAATDSESYYYCLTFSPELLQEWSWTQRYPGREETQSYMRFVADKCDMWPYIQLNTEIVDAQYMEERGYWQVTTGDGSIFTCKYFISGMGMISEPMIPKIAGMDKFKGPIFHSSRWPTEGLDYAGKKVGIIGAGATTVQMLPVVAETAGSVTVFQRTPNYILPAMQKLMTPEWEKEIKSNYDGIISKCRNHVFGMAFDSPVGRIGAVICWENFMPRFRAALYAQGVTLWAAPTVDDRPQWEVAMRHIAHEGRCFLVGACQWLPPSQMALGEPITLIDRPHDAPLIAGGSLIVSPMGEVLAGPLRGGEGLVTAEVDLADIVRARFDFDAAGHYARSDLFGTDMFRLDVSGAAG